MDERLRYGRDGILFPVAVLTAAEVRRYRCACEELEAELGGRPRTVEVRQMHLHFPWASQLATQGRVLAAVERLLGPNLLVWSTELFVKHPGDGISVRWHRDEDYTGFDPALSTTAWIALSASTSANGCLQVVPGSHHGDPPVCNQTSVATESSTDSEPKHRVIDVELRPGEMSLHDGRLLHGSAANGSAETRIGFAVRYVVPAAQPLHGRPPVLLAQGVDEHDHFQIVPPPSEADNDRALERMRQSASRHLDGMLENRRRRKTRV